MKSVDYPVKVNVVTEFLTDESAPEDHYYLFDYHVFIHNESDKIIQLLSRHWIITDGNGHKKEIKGTGVVGQQPYIKPDEIFEYTSTTSFSTPVGSMYGKYSMQVETGELVDVLITPFRLAAPGVLH